jgi:hypothetical protein
MWNRSADPHLYARGDPSRVEEKKKQENEEKET